MFDSRGFELKKGDLIEFKNPTDIYAHWAVYIGDGNVIDVIANNDEKKSGPSGRSSGASSSIPNSFAEGLSAAVFGVDTIVRQENIMTVAQGRTFFRNNTLDTELPPLPVNRICARAVGLVGKKWDYKLLSSNCEHFASEMRYGVAVSLQTIAVEEFVEDAKEKVEDFVEEAKEVVISYVTESTRDLGKYLFGEPP